MKRLRLTFFREYPWRPRIPGSRRLWFALLATFLLILAFIEIADEVVAQTNGQQTSAQAFDELIIDSIAPFRSPLLNQTMTDLTSLGSLSLVILLSVVVYGLLSVLRDRRGMLHLTIVLAGIWFIPQTLKVLVGRARPQVLSHLVGVSDLSFPSGHAFGAAAVYSTLAFLAARHVRNRQLGAFFFALCGLVIGSVGFSRIYLGVHYPTDVIAGICAGMAWSILLMTVMQSLYSRRQSPEAFDTAH